MKVQLGKTKMRVCKDGFGALPIQRVSDEESTALLQRALEGGIDFFDTARMYTNSEEKIGLALSQKRSSYILATKTAAHTVEKFWEDLHTSLQKLRTDYVDLYQFHNLDECPLPGDGTGLYEAMAEAKKQGKIRFVGLTNHRLQVAKQAVESGLYDTLQYPFSYLSSREEEDLVRLCEQLDVGFIAMKALSGGLITDIGAARSWMARFESVVPIWGIQRMQELEQLLQAMQGPPEITAAQKRRIEEDRKELVGAFCRGCGYCEPCPANIDIKICARISLLLRRAPSADYLTPAWQAEMAKIDNCVECGACAQRCPYGLEPHTLLKKNHADYLNFMQ